MADTEVIREKETGKGNLFLTWLAVILSIAALVLAWTAFNRTGEDLESKIQRQVNSAVEQVENKTELRQETNN